MSERELAWGGRYSRKVFTPAGAICVKCGRSTEGGFQCPVCEPWSPEAT